VHTCMHARNISFSYIPFLPIRCDSNELDTAWVKRAVEDAQESLEKAEAAAVEQKRESLSLWENEVWQ